MDRRYYIILLCVLFLNLYSLASYTQIHMPPLPPDDVDSSLVDKNNVPEISDLSYFPKYLTPFDSININVKVIDNDDFVRRVYLNFYNSIINDSVDMKLIDSDIYNVRLSPFNSEYIKFQIISEDNYNKKSLSEEYTIKLNFPKPEISVLDIETESFNQVKLSWVKPKYANKSIIEYSKDSLFENYSSLEYFINNSLDTCVYIIKNLDVDHEYYFRIKNSNDYSIGEYSSIAWIRLPKVSTFVTFNAILDTIKLISPINDLIIEYIGDIIGGYAVHDINITSTSPNLSFYKNGEFKKEIKLIPYDNGKVDFKLKIRYIPSEIKKTIDTIFLSSSNIDTLSIPIDVQVISETPKIRLTDVDCYFYDDSTFCLNWKSPKANQDFLVVLSNNEFKPKDGIEYSDTITSDLVLWKLCGSMTQYLLEKLKWNKYNYYYIFPFNGKGLNINYQTDSVHYQKIVPLYDNSPYGWINEFHYDNGNGSDTLEYIEVCVENNDKILSYNEFSVHFYNGADGENDKVWRLDSLMIQDTVKGIIFFVIPNRTFSIQNGVDGLALAYKGKLLQFISWEGVFKAIDGPAKDYFSTDVGVSESNSTAKGTSIQMIRPGDQVNEFFWESNIPNSFGKINDNQIIINHEKNEWIGRISSNWFDSNNWSLGIPDENTKIYIPRDTPHKLEIPSAYRCFSIEMAENSSLLMDENLSDTTLIIYHQHLYRNRWTYISSPVLNYRTNWFDVANGVLQLIYYNTNTEKVWVSLTDKFSFLKPGVGYGIRANKEDLNVDFIGFKNPSNFKIPIQYDKKSLDNWNFIGNPFLCALSWPLVDIHDITGTAYLFDPESEHYVAMDSEGYVSNPSVQSQIPPIQGFFVKAVSSGFLNFSNADKVAANQNFLKTKNKDVTIYLKVKTIDKRETYDYSLIVLGSKYLDYYNSKYDSDKFFYQDLNNPQIYINKDQHLLSIAKFQYKEQIIEFDICSNIPESTKIELSISVKNLDPKYKLNIEDKAENETIEFDSDLNYKTNYKNCPNRFRLNIKELDTKDKIDDDKEPISKVLSDEIYMYAINDILYVKSKNEMLGEIFIYNKMGQKIGQHKIQYSVYEYFNIENEKLLIIQYIDQKTQRVKTFKVLNQ